MNLVIANRQRKKKINVRLLRAIVDELFAELKITDAELGINLVGAREMTLVNETFLQHEGATDVITFDHVEPVAAFVKMRTKMKKPARIRAFTSAATLHGELFICMDVAISQAQEFKTDWQSEVVRYIVHGVLHLLGYDDLKPDLRRAMKREENRLVRHLEKKISFAELACAVKLRT